VPGGPEVLRAGEHLPGLGRCHDDARARGVRSVAATGAADHAAHGASGVVPGGERGPELPVHVRVAEWGCVVRGGGRDPRDRARWPRRRPRRAHRDRVCGARGDLRASLRGLRARASWRHRQLERRRRLRGDRPRRGWFSRERADPRRPAPRRRLFSSGTLSCDLVTECHEASRSSLSPRGTSCGLLLPTLAARRGPTWR
jgi:hypothetical protein